MSRGGAPRARRERAELLDRKQAREFLRWLIRPRYGDALGEDGVWRLTSFVDDPRMERFVVGHGPNIGRDIYTSWAGTFGSPRLAILRIEPRGFEAPALELGYPLPSAYEYVREVAATRHIVVGCLKMKRMLGLEVTADFAPVEQACAASRWAVAA